jgi:predicted TIM-barrel enzyme
MRRSLVSALALIVLFTMAGNSGIGSHSTVYMGGTVTSIPQAAEGTCSTEDEKIFTFQYKGGQLSIPYDRINELEYGQKAGRRIGLAIAVSPVALLSKKRRHFLTISYVDQNEKQQAAVFELGKDIVRTTLASLQARSGRKVEFQDEEARKSGFGS